MNNMCITKKAFKDKGFTQLEALEHVFNQLEATNGGLLTVCEPNQLGLDKTHCCEIRMPVGNYVYILWDEPEVTNSQLIETAMELAEEDDNMGVCHHCGETQWGCEPDARAYECESCGKRAVFGAAETIMMLGGAF